MWNRMPYMTGLTEVLAVVGGKMTTMIVEGRERYPVQVRYQRASGGTRSRLGSYGAYGYPSFGGMIIAMLTVFMVPVLYCWVEER